MMKRYLFLSLFILSTLVVSCKKNTKTLDLGYDYFPLEEGTFVEYDVMLVNHDVDLIPQHDTIRYRLKTIIGEDVLDNLGRKAKKYFRYSYDLETGDLLDQRVWTMIIDEGIRGEIVEENQRKIRLIFSPKVGKEWDVNAYNTQGKQVATYMDVDVPRTINGKELLQTAKIEYGNKHNLVDFKRMHETYARGIGLVERHFKDLTISNFDTTLIKKGTETHYTLIDYGVE